ncbi:MAG: metallophosphoesterase [Burkholderia sp.]|nr:metallophosphoesterase [Burkholderia sp.]
MLPVLSLLLHAYVGARLLPEIAGWPVLAGLLALSLATSALFMPMGIGIGGRLAGAGHNTARLVTWLGWAGMGLFSTLFVLTVIRELLLLVAFAANLTDPGLVNPDSFQRNSALAVALLGFLITLLGFSNARRTAAVSRVTVPINKLPAALQGFQLVQISDIHIGPTIRGDYLRRIVLAVNRLQPDMVAITGDLVDGSVRELGPHVAPLAELVSRHGSYFVTGNHEYYSGAHSWIAELRRLGVTVLLNDHVVLSHDGALAVIAGVTDYSAAHFDASHQSNPFAAIAGAPPSAGVKILLAHQPRSAPAAADAGFDLQLSGHTHGGQFMPWNFFVKMQQPFVAGLHRLRQLWVYTSRGTGYWGPPKRFGAPSEITLVTLVAA